MTWLICYDVIWGIWFQGIFALGVVHPSNLCPIDHQLTGRWFWGRILTHQSPGTQLEWPQLGDIPPFSDKPTYHLVGSRSHEYPIPLYISTVAHIWCQVGLPIIHQSFHQWILLQHLAASLSNLHRTDPRWRTWNSKNAAWDHSIFDWNKRHGYVPETFPANPLILIKIYQNQWLVVARTL